MWYWIEKSRNVGLEKKLNNIIYVTKTYVTQHSLFWCEFRAVCCVVFSNLFYGSLLVSQLIRNTAMFRFYYYSEHLIFNPWTATVVQLKLLEVSLKIYKEGQGLWTTNFAYLRPRSFQYYTKLSWLSYFSFLIRTKI